MLNALKHRIEHIIFIIINVAIAHGVVVLLADILPGQGLYYESVTQTWRYVCCCLGALAFD